MIYIDNILYIARGPVETHKSVSLYLDYGSSESMLSTFISYASKLKKQKSKRVESRYTNGNISIRRIPRFTGRDVWRTVISRESCIDIIRENGTSSGFEDPEGACPRAVEVGSGRRSGQSWYYER